MSSGPPWTAAKKKEQLSTAVELSKRACLQWKSRLATQSELTDDDWQRKSWIVKRIISRIKVSYWTSEEFSGGCTKIKQMNRNYFQVRWDSRLDANHPCICTWIFLDDTCPQNENKNKMGEVCLMGLLRLQHGLHLTGNFQQCTVSVRVSSELTKLADNYAS